MLDQAESVGEELTLVELTLSDGQRLTCCVGGVVDRRGVFCVDTAPISERLAATGPGALLRDAEGRGVVYLAIQDEWGILAASPSVERLSSVREDPFLRDLADQPADPIARGRPLPVPLGHDAAVEWSAHAYRLRKGTAKQEIRQKIESYPLTRGLKNKILAHLLQA